MKIINFKVDGMSCPHCEHKICKTLLDLKGVKTASASVNEGKIIVKFDDNIIDEKKIADIITEIGYTVTRQFNT